MGYSPAAFSPLMDTAVSPSSRFSVGTQMHESYALTQPTSTAWPTANLAIYVPFAIERAVTVYQVGWHNGATTVSGTREVGVYTAAGTKIISGAATGSGTSFMQRVDVTDTLLDPGQYWLAITCTNTTNWLANAPAAPMCAALGILTEAAANPLPATATMALNNTLAFIPVGFLQFRSSL